MKGFQRILKVSIIIAIVIELFELLINFNEPIVYQKELRDLAIHFMFAFSLTLVNGYFFDKIGDYFTWEREPQKRLWFGAIGSIIITMATLAVLRFTLVVLIYGKSWAHFINTENISYYVIGFIITLFFSVFFHAFYFYKELQKQKITEQKIIADTA